MIWQLRGDWPIGATTIPAGTRIGLDGTPIPKPLNAMALNEDAALQMAMWYDEVLWHQLHFAPGIDREAIFAQARHEKRWPNGVPSQTQPISEAAVKEEKPRRSRNARRR